MTGIIGEIVTGLLGIIGMVWVAVISRRSTDRAADLTSAATWISRIEALEKTQRELQAEISTMRLDFGAAVGFIDRIGWWLAGGQRTPFPLLPGRIRPHLSDPELFPDPTKEQPS